jgi:hypothetical protein
MMTFALMIVAFGCGVLLAALVEALSYRNFIYAERLSERMWMERERHEARELVEDRTTK